MTYQFSVLPHLAIRSVIGPDRPFLTVGWLQAGESWSSIVHLFALLEYPWLWNSQRLRLFASASPHRMVHLSIYRPGSEVPTRQFFDQFSSVLECLITRNSQLLIMGDFNLPLKDQTDPDSISFRDILSQFGLRQHINETTHKLGGILDLVITADNEQVRDLQVQPPTISAHAYIQFWLPHLHSQPLHAIRKTRGWRSLDRRMLSDALR